MQARILTQCEVDGVPYKAGDGPVEMSEEQYASLRKFKAVAPFPVVEVQVKAPEVEAPVVHGTKPPVIGRKSRKRRA